MTTTRVSLGDGRLLDVLVAGSLDGPGGRVVPAHHGTPSTAKSWHDWAEPLRAEGFSLVACSRPGYTGSTRSGGAARGRAATDAVALAPERCSRVVTVAGVVPVSHSRGLGHLALPRQYRREIIGSLEG